MGVKRLLRTFVVLTLLAITGLTAYYHYVEGKTPTSAAFKALEQYNGVMNGVVTALLDAVAQYRDSA